MKEEEVVEECKRRDSTIVMNERQLLVVVL